MIDAPDRQLRTGEIVRSPSGGYEILEYRTTTQRSICYFARHLNGGERIFLKQWLSSVPADQVLRAERAYADVGTANIPGLVGSKEIFEDNDTRYLVTEVVGPYNPEHWCGGTAPLPVGRGDRVAYLLLELYRLVFALHGIGYVHRDIHLDNILVGQDGKVYLIDLSDAVALDDPDFDILARSGPHEVFGAEPPECLDGQPHGCAGDVWQATMTAFYLITGVRFSQQPEARPRLSRAY